MPRVKGNSRKGKTVSKADSESTSVCVKHVKVGGSEKSEGRLWDQSRKSLHC